MKKTYPKPKHANILLIYYDLSLGGIQTKMISLANTLVNKGAKCRIFLETLGTYPRTHQLNSQVTITTFSKIRLFGKQPLRGWRTTLLECLLAYIVRPYSIFISLQPLATQFIKSATYINPRLLRRTIVNEDTFPSLKYSSTSPKGKRQLASLYNQAKYVIAVSKSTYTDLKENFRIKSPPLIYLPNWTTFKGATTPKASGRNIDIVYGGRLAPQKRPLLMLKLFSQLLERNPNFSIHIYGDGETKNTVLNKINYSALKHHVHYHLPVQNFEPILKRSKILIFTSLYEGLPITGIEAMKCGVIVAGLDVPGVKDLIVRNKTGLLEKSVPKLAEQITKLLKNPKRLNQLRQNAYRYAKKHFSEKNEQRLIGMLIE